MKTTIITAATLIATGLSTIAAAETTTAPTIFFDMSIGQTQISWTDSFGVAQANSSLWGYTGQRSSSAGGLTYSVVADPDPVLGFDFTFSNDTDTTQSFNVVMTLPVTPWPGETKIGALIGGSVTDANANGHAVLSSVNNSSIFTGSIDGATWLPLMSDVLVEVPNAGGTSFITDIDGLPGPTKTGPTVVDSHLTIELNFQLTAGDEASFSGMFIVEYVPAPAGTLLLFGAGFIGRRRRD